MKMIPNLMEEGQRDDDVDMDGEYELWRDLREEKREAEWKKMQEAIGTYVELLAKAQKRIDDLQFELDERPSPRMRGIGF